MIISLLAFGCASLTYAPTVEITTIVLQITNTKLSKCNLLYFIHLIFEGNFVYDINYK